MFTRLVIRLLLAASLIPVADQMPARAASGAPGLLIDVPFVRQQNRHACGAASLAMLIRYWEKQRDWPRLLRADPVLIERALDPHGRGISSVAMAGYLRDSGFRVFVFAGRWADLRENLAKGRPLIVGLGTENGRGPLHYVVVAGIDWDHDFVFVNDPAERKLFRMTRDRFTAEWRATDRWTLLAVPKLPE